MNRLPSAAPRSRGLLLCTVLLQLVTPVVAEIRS